MILYTSGTTGRPKGALLSHANLTFNTMNQLAHVDVLSTDTALCMCPLFHATGLGQVSLPTIFKGGTVVVTPKFVPRWVVPLRRRHPDGRRRLGLRRRPDQGHHHLRGENIYPAQVEAVIGSLPGVADCALIPVPDQRWGEVGLAFVVQAPAGAWTEASLRDALRTELAAFKIPKYARFADQLPRTATGKVRKQELRSLAAAEGDHDAHDR